MENVYNSTKVEMGKTAQLMKELKLKKQNALAEWHS
jgi:hypothetical protein